MFFSEPFNMSFKAALSQFSSQHIPSESSDLPKGGVDKIALALFVLLVICVAYYFYKKQGGIDMQMPGSAKDEKYITAKMLHAAGAKVYGSKTCGYTVRQMEKFGQYSGMITYIECSSSNEACREIKGFPSWNIGGEELLGDQSLETLRSAAEKTLRGGGPANAKPVAPDPVDPVGFGGQEVHAII